MMDVDIDDVSKMTQEFSAIAQRMFKTAMKKDCSCPHELREGAEAILRIQDEMGKVIDENRLVTNTLDGVEEMIDDIHAHYNRLLKKLVKHYMHTSLEELLDDKGQIKV